MNKVKIISTTFAIILNNQVISEILDVDQKAWKEPLLFQTLKDKLKERNEVKDVFYADWAAVPGDKGGDRILITVFKDSINNPDKNQNYWQEIADEVNKHLEEGTK